MKQPKNSIDFSIRKNFLESFIRLSIETYITRLLKSPSPYRRFPIRKNRIKPSLIEHAL